MELERAPRTRKPASLAPALGQSGPLRWSLRLPHTTVWNMVFLAGEGLPPDLGGRVALEQAVKATGGWARLGRQTLAAL